MTRFPSFRRNTLVAMASTATACALVAGAIVGCPEVTTPDPQAGVTDVRIEGIAFNPAVVTIQQGQSVRWTNFDIVPHTSTSGNPGDSNAGSTWDSGFLQAGQSFSQQFNETGEFVYFCQVHPFMMRDARVTVTP